MGRDPWCCTISLDLEPIGGADDADDHGSRTTRQHQDDRDLDLDLDGRTTRRTLVLSPPLVLRNQLAGPVRHVT